MSAPKMNFKIAASANFKKHGSMRLLKKTKLQKRKKKKRKT
jgi:hypothetical protein